MKKRVLRIGGLELPVTDAPVTAEINVICMRVEDMPTSRFKDDLFGNCAVCNAAVRFRPYMAPGRKLCLRCAPKDYEAHQRGPRQ